MSAVMQRTGSHCASSREGLSSESWRAVGTGAVETDQQGIIGQIKSRFEPSPEWTVKPLTDAALIGMELRPNDGLGLFLNFSQSGDRFSITGFSTCFPFEPKLGADY